MTGSPSQDVDVCVIGGGINGVGIARDAAGRGLRVALLEQDDLAQGTSSRSGKLVHGGLRYLEYYEFRLVREALMEREVLLKSAPHIIWPLRFVLPHSPNDRPAWLIRAGLFLYDRLGGRGGLPGSRSLDLSQCVEGDDIKEDYRKAFEYSDCWVDDSRLTVLNAVDAANHGAHVHTRTRCIGAKRVEDGWAVNIEDTLSGARSCLTAKALVNAAGPWVNNVIDSVESVTTSKRVRLVKGSHIVVTKFWQGENSFLIQNDDKRVIFINAYENDYALIGTTDIPFDGDPADVDIDDAETDYLLKAVNRYFITQLSKRDIVSSFSGVRPLFDDAAENPSAVTRDYLFEVDDVNNQFPLLTVFGGKITTYRKMAEHAVTKLAPYFPQMKSRWTANAALPGGAMENADFELFAKTLTENNPELPATLCRYYARTYGTNTDVLLDGARTINQLGRQFGELFFEAEAHYLINHEWAKTAEDILQRRTKHGLHLSAEQRQAFNQWMQSGQQGTSHAG